MLTHHYLLVFTFLCSVDLRDLHSFPTRRSSDLGAAFGPFGAARPSPHHARLCRFPGQRLERDDRGGGNRSEEHTSELQSLRHLVCRLLLEKKKKTIQRMNSA